MQKTYLVSTTDLSGAEINAACATPVEAMKIFMIFKDSPYTDACLHIAVLEHDRKGRPIIYQDVTDEYSTAIAWAENMVDDIIGRS